MRKTAVALALLLLASFGAAVPTVAAASGEPKVVIIVGATHGATASYRNYADRAYAEAIKYTSNVVKVYSPNATWARVQAAVSGASVVIYMGHGNGWPSPYTFDPNYTTKNGFGLNATESAGDYNNKYYGEPYVSTLDLAPGAVVMLHHLCYAAGNSEPGQPEPSESVARQRVDNYAAGFLKAGAGAVIADGHAGPEGYLQALFTTQQSIESLWANQPNANGNIVSFASTRTPGATAFQDPESPTSGYYRSVVVRATGVIPDGLADSTAIDTTPSQLTALMPSSTTPLSFAPNGDGYRETVALTAATSEPGSVIASVRNAAGTEISSWSVAAGIGPTKVVWDGRDANGWIAPDGWYVLSVAPRDASGNTGPSQERTISLVGALGSVTSSRPIFYPQDLDTLAPTTELSFSLSRPMSVTWTLRDAAGNVVDTHLAAVPLEAGSHLWTFDGRLSDGSMVRPGRYVSHVAASDGSVVAYQSVAFEADAFVVKPSDSTPGRGQRLTVTVTTAEPLAANPRVTVSQPGFAAWAVTTVKLSSTTYRATIKLKTGGPIGNVRFKASGRDTSGATQQTARAFPLH